MSASADRAERRLGSCRMWKCSRPTTILLLCRQPGSEEAGAEARAEAVGVAGAARVTTALHTTITVITTRSAIVRASEHSTPTARSVP